LKRSPKLKPVATRAPAASPLSELRFRGEFRTYQKTVLAQAESEGSDGRLHIVAPPGAGKTVIGVELARHFGHPAVVFAPTTTIQQQWLHTVGLFTEDALESVVSDDPARIAPLGVFTYQLIATQDHADEDFREAAARLWAETLVDEGHERTSEAALARIAAVRANNPSWYRREEARYRSELRRRMLREDPSSLGTILHDNARRLVTDLVAGGVRTVVLDECHHLLDYWALVIRFLVSRIEQPMVIGLTATLPDPETELEEENYFALLGDVDFEVPTPALVREGILAPYRDLVLFVSPTPEEREFLKRSDEAFVTAQRALTDSARFRSWLHGTLFGADPSTTTGAWTAAVASDALLAFSGLRVLRALEDRHGVPAAVDVPEIAQREPQFEDWTLVIERFALQVLAPSPSEDDHRLQHALRGSLKPFGLTLTERGLRRGRSPVDRIVSLSDAKAGGAATILRLEHGVLGSGLRATVVCDYDREQARASLPGSLGAGSARGVFAALAGDVRLADDLRPVLVTASVLAAPTPHAEMLRERLLEMAGAANLELALEPSDHPGVTTITARRGPWTPKRYVALVTEMLQAGEVRCVVGTRALLGEGWDAPSLNTLVDLTTATTPQSVEQLRGRTIRLDPADPHKVAHNWDVIASVPLVAGGDNDLQRFLRRHRHTWGIVLGREYEKARLALELPDEAPLPASIERGPRHVDPDLIAKLQEIELTSITIGHVARRTEGALEASSERSLAAIRQRDLVREAWGIGGPVDGIVTEAASVRLEEPGLRTTGYVAATTRSLLRSLAATFLVGVGIAFSALARTGGWSSDGLLVAVAVFVGGLAVSAGLAVRVLRRLLVEEPPDLILLDIGRALALSLTDAGLIAMNGDTPLRSVWCREDRSGQLLVGLTAGREDQRLFTSCMSEVFRSRPETRYLIRRTDRRLPSLFANVVWTLLRTIARRLGAGSARDNFLAVPRVLGRSRKRAENFAMHWRAHVGGGQLVDTRDVGAATAILEARSASRLQALADRVQTFGQQLL
jgi:superfamily II DNA or RNA helicase